MEYFQTYYWHRSEKRWKIGRKLDSAFVKSERKRESTSLDITSSFFWSSPCIFEAPCKPVRLEIPALCTRDAICLQASEMLDNTMVNSASMIPFCSCCKSQPVKVSISYWLLLCLGAGGSTLTAALATPAALPDCLLQLYSCPLAFKPTIEPRKQDPVQKSGCKYEVPPPPLLLGRELSLLLHPELLELTTVGDAANAAAVVDAMISPCHTTRAYTHTTNSNTQQQHNFLASHTGHTFPTYEFLHEFAILAKGADFEYAYPHGQMHLKLLELEQNPRHPCLEFVALVLSHICEAHHSSSNPPLDQQHFTLFRFPLMSF